MPPPRFLCLALLSALVATLVVTRPGVARAQDTLERREITHPVQPAVTMPVVKKDDGVSYPKAALDAGFHEPAEVVLTLTVDATGAVTEATVTTPVGHGFDEAAVAAARKIVFDPATRNGTPIPARIRFSYKFTPPPAALGGRVVTLASERPLAGATVTARDAAGAVHTATTAPDGSWRIPDLAPGTYHVTVSAAGMVSQEADATVQAGEEVRAVDRLAPPKVAPPPPVAAADGGVETIEEVEIKGERPPREVSKFTIDQREISRIPGTNGDALRSLQNLPGVARSPGLGGVLLIRGSGPDATPTFINGTPVPIIYHFGGLSSVVPTEMIDKIDFYPGNFSSEYGRATGGAVDVGLASPKSDGFHVLAEADLIDVRTIVQGPIGNTGWTLALGGRRSWFDLWLGPVLTATGANVSLAPVYYDYQAILERKLGAHQALRFSFFGSDDRFSILSQSTSSSSPTLAGTLGERTGFWRAQALYTNKIGRDTDLRVVAAVGQDYQEFNAGTLFFNLTDTPITSRVEVGQKIDPHLTMNLGLDLYDAPYYGAAQFPPPPKAGSPPTGPFAAQPPVATTARGNEFQPAAYVELEATPWKGTRIVPGMRLDYTLSTNVWDLSPRVVVRQDLTDAPRTTLKAGLGVFTQPPALQETNSVFGTPGLKSERAYQYDLGVEREITKQVDFTLDGFYKQLDNLVSPGIGSTGSGVIYGGETLLRYKADDRFFGWIAYTLSRSVRRDAPGMPLSLFQYDETHVLTIIGSYRIGRGWELGMRFRLASGFMDTPSAYGFYDENVGTNLPLSSYPPFGTRLALFHSLDIRVDKTWQYRWGKIGAYLDVLNVYDQANVDGTGYNYNYTQSSPVNDLPILPSVGLRVEH